MSLDHSTLNQNPLFTAHIEQAKTWLCNQALPDPPTLMPKTHTTSKHDAVKEEFVACHKELEESKDAVLAADAGQPHKAALDNMLSIMVNLFHCPYLVAILLTLFLP